jgi:hypothetical protein
VAEREASIETVYLFVLNKRKFKVKKQLVYNKFNVQYFTVSMIKAIIWELILWLLHNIWYIQHEVEGRYIGLVVIIWIILIPIVFKIILVILTIVIMITVKNWALVQTICLIIWMLKVILAGHHHLLLSLILYHLCWSLVGR